MRWVVDRIKLNVKSALNFREAFLISVAGMVINDLFWILVIYFLGSFSIMGFDSRSYLIAFAFSTLSYGLVGILFGGLRNISKIYTGELDAFLTKPGSAFLHVATSKTRFEDFGDLLLGVTLLLLLKPPLISILFFPFTFVLFLSFTLFSFSLHFFIYEPTNKFHSMLQFLPLTFALWPSFILPFPFSIIPYLIFPGAWMSFGLIEIARGSRAPAQLLLTTLFWTLLACFTWRKGLKRYSSGTSLGLID